MILKEKWITWYRKNGHGLWVLYYAVCIVLYKLTLLREPVFMVHSVIDDIIPFCEIFIIPYFIWYIYLFAAFFAFFKYSKEQFIRFCIFMYVGMTLAYIWFALVPNGIEFKQDLSTLGRENIFTWMVEVILSFDKPRNVCPSLHCYASLVICMAVSKSKVFTLGKNGSFKRQRYMSIIAWTLSILICMSTMFIKQHSIWDLVFAILLAAAIYPVAYLIKWKIPKDEIR